MDESHHYHHHEHVHDISNVKAINLYLVILLNFGIAFFEIIGGIFSGSVSLFSDAMHNFSDGISVFISYIALKVQNKKNDEKRTFGYKRSGIVSAFINSLALILISLFIFKEAYEKFLHPSNINSSVIISVAFLAIFANSLGVFLLYKGSKEDMNIKSSYLHLLGDTLSSIGVVVAGVLIFFFHINWVDPLIGALISLYILKESFDILKRSTNILFEGVPNNIDVYKIVEELKKIDGIKDIHHVHIWCLNEKNINFEAHVNIEDVMVSQTKKTLVEIEEKLKKFGINHVTIQFEHNFCNGIGVIKN
ncbi:cation diffusion facilitator family transporter [Thermodesulfobium narugense DSM 14796]|uniref:Cation diffusion facilitator family transporter n=1 Tax=Thermodesulfobium narugense DSM 14796 TaxID=747365 RepID=M1E7E1_9BACT|nr:cation diffusion facilitator family transporter [Thermodesulfobium narugense]AEE14425.1 cation diffusion facilitator family transporter [Thermodesulfobium narugense DSM 14796]